jgi:hypothetical protein
MSSKTSSLKKMVELQQQFSNLVNLPAEATAADKRRRGFAFEKFLERLLTQEELAPRLRLRPTGEEIDGSFDLHNRVFLLEAKWHAEPLPASAIYAFQGKVNGKLSGTLGVFISMSGFSDDVTSALTAGKSLNVILFDANDIRAVITHSFAKVLNVKLRAAAEEGVVFFPFTSTLATVLDDHSTAVDIVPTNQLVAANNRQILILCEGPSDTFILNELGQRILAQENLAASLRLVAAQGKHGIPRVLNAVYPLLPQNTPVIVVADGDRQVYETEQLITKQTSVRIDTLVIIDPQIEAWIAPDNTDSKAKLQKLARDAKLPFQPYLEMLIQNLSLDSLRSDQQSFDAFYNGIVRAARQPKGD